MKYPIGVQDFEKIRVGGYKYVDKTSYVYQLANTGSYFFLSRPRRFGKSLLLSTFKAYFEGRRELFEGLAAESLETEWKSYPVLYLDLNVGKYDSPERLDHVLSDYMGEWEQRYQLPCEGVTQELRFRNIVRNLSEKTGKPVVILVDEYDKPMLQSIGNDSLQDSFRSTLKAFYGVLKTMDAYIRFAFLTGVTKFGKVSVFSDLNNLRDLSLDYRYNAICGITEQELVSNFQEGVAALAAHEGISEEQALEQLRLQYDGYHFSEIAEGVYNPFSLLNALESSQMKDYWFETGTPSFLVELLKRSDYDLRQLQEESVSADVLNSIDSLSVDPIPFVFQSGYLTIKSYNPEFKSYVLGFPNREVEQGFTRYLLPYYSPQPSRSVFYIENFISDVRSGNPERFMERLQAFFDDSDYRVAGKMEKYFQNAMYVLFRMMGFYTQVERATSRGRIDVTIQTSQYVYILELKLDGTPAEALAQIEQKGYAAPFALDKRQVFKIGVAFSSETRGISDWEIAR